MRALEERFPTLYYDIVHVRAPGAMGEVKEQRTAKRTPPTLRDVIHAVLEANGLQAASGVVSDVAKSVNEFLGGGGPEQEEEVQPKKRTAKD